MFRRKRTAACFAAAIAGGLFAMPVMADEWSGARLAVTGTGSFCPIEISRVFGHTNRDGRLMVTIRNTGTATLSFGAGMQLTGDGISARGVLWHVRIEPNSTLEKFSTLIAPEGPTAGSRIAIDVTGCTTAG